LIEQRFLQYALSLESFSVSMSACDIKKKADAAERP